MIHVLASLAGLLVPIGVALLGGFMGVFLMAILSDSARSATVDRVGWTYKVVIGSMVVLGLSGLVIGPATWLRAEGPLQAGLAVAAVAVVAALLAFVRYYVAVARG